MLFASAVYLNGNVIIVDDHDLLSMPVEEIKAVRPAIMVASGRREHAG